MATTVNNMSISLSRRLADEVSAGTTDGERFSSAQRLAALDAAYNQVVMAVLGATNTKKSAYQLLGELAEREAATLQAAGKSLDSFSYRVCAGGIINVECQINGSQVFSVEREYDDLQYAANYYFKGNDKRPVFYVLSNTLMLEVTLGSYPVSAFVHYIRQPRQLHATLDDSVYTNVLETNGILDEVIFTGAVSVAQMMSDDQQKVALNAELSQSELRSMIMHEFGKSNKRDKGDA